MVGRYGQVVRARVIPANPNTPSQATAREKFKSQSQRWDSLTDAQRTAWTQAAKTINSQKRLGTSGALTGNQHFVKTNVQLSTQGAVTVDVPPVLAPAPAMPFETMAIANAGGILSIKLHSPTELPTGTEIWGAAPVKAGVARTPQMVFLGLSPALAQGDANVTGLYVSKFGEPNVGQRVFIAARTTTPSSVGVLVPFNAVVPAEG